MYVLKDESLRTFYLTQILLCDMALSSPARPPCRGRERSVAAARRHLDGEARVHRDVREPASKMLGGVACEEPLAEEAPDGVEAEEHEGHKHTLDAVDADAALRLDGESEGEKWDRVDGAGQGLEGEFAGHAQAPEGQGGLGPTIVDVVADQDLAAQALIHVEDGKEECEDNNGGKGLEGLGPAIGAASL